MRTAVADVILLQCALYKMVDVSKYAASASLGPFPSIDMPVTHASGPDTVTPSGPTRLGDAFVNIPSFEEMLVNGNVRLGKEGDSEAYTGWVEKGKASS